MARREVQDQLEPMVRRVGLEFLVPRGLLGQLVEQVLLVLQEVPGRQDPSAVVGQREVLEQAGLLDRPDQRV